MSTKIVFRPGYALIEALVSIAIIGLLVSTVAIVSQAIQLKTQTTQALTDLQDIARELETYKANYGHYPLSCGTGGSWASRDANPWGCGLGACWIPQFAGEGYCPLSYNRSSPPSGMTADRSQYLYITDPTGNEYKLIFHYPVSMAVSAEFFDSQRPGRAFGVWSASGADF